MAAFSSELRNYRQVATINWPLVPSMGFLFAWLLAFPVQGPLLAIMARDLQLDPQRLVILFLLGHVTGLASAGVAGCFSRKGPYWFSLGGVPCTAISLMLAIGTSLPWAVFFALMGFSSAFSVVSWGVSFARSVVPGGRGRTFILGAMLANVWLYVAGQIGSADNFTTIMAITSLFPLVTPVALRYCRRRDLSEVSAPSNASADLSNRSHWPALPFIFGVYVVGGLMYFVVARLSAPPEGWLASLTLIPYIVFLIPAGSLADCLGRRVNGFSGAIIVGVGFMSVGLLGGVAQFLAIQTLVVGGYAFLDTFVAVVAADLAGGRNGPARYALVVATNVLAILVGTLAGERIGELATGRDMLIVSLGGLLTFLSVGFASKLAETLPPPSQQSSDGARPSRDALNRLGGLTRREREVAVLLLSGASTDEILQRLVVAPDTLKSHVRNIYRKAGVRNRLEFVIALRDGQDGTAAAQRTSLPSREVE